MYKVIGPFAFLNVLDFEYAELLQTALRTKTLEKSLKLSKEATCLFFDSTYSLLETATIQKLPNLCPTHLSKFYNFPSVSKTSKVV